MPSGSGVGSNPGPLAPESCVLPMLHSTSTYFLFKFCHKSAYERATFLSDLESGQLVNKQKKMLTVDVYDVNICFRAKDNANNILVTSKTFLGPIQIVKKKKNLRFVT